MASEEQEGDFNGSMAYHPSIAAAGSIDAVDSPGVGHFSKYRQALLG